MPGRSRIELGNLTRAMSEGLPSQSLREWRTSRIVAGKGGKMRPMTQKEAAQIAGVSRSTYAGWESGRRKPGRKNAGIEERLKAVRTPTDPRERIPRGPMPTRPGIYFHGQVGPVGKGQGDYKRARGIFLGYGDELSQRQYYDLREALVRNDTEQVRDIMSSALEKYGSKNEYEGAWDVSEVDAWDFL